EAELGCEELLGFGVVQGARGPREDAAGALPERLHERVPAVVELHLELDRGRGAREPEGEEVGGLGRAVSLEEGGADRLDDGALAGLVGSDEEVQPGGEPVERDRLDEALELAEGDAFEDHAGLVEARTSARRISASSAISGVAPEVPSRSAASARPTYPSAASRSRSSAERRVRRPWSSTRRPAATPRARPSAERSRDREARSTEPRSSISSTSRGVIASSVSTNASRSLSTASSASMVRHRKRETSTDSTRGSSPGRSSSTARTRPQDSWRKRSGSGVPA